MSDDNDARPSVRIGGAQLDEGVYTVKRVATGKIIAIVSVNWNATNPPTQIDEYWDQFTAVPAGSPHYGLWQDSVLGGGEDSEHLIWTKVAAWTYGGGPPPFPPPWGPGRPKPVNPTTIRRWKAISVPTDVGTV